MNQRDKAKALLDGAVDRFSDGGVEGEAMHANMQKLIDTLPLAQVDVLVENDTVRSLFLNAYYQGGLDHVLLFKEYLKRSDK